MSVVRISVTNWKSHNSGRKDVLNNSWFKLKNGIFESPSIISLTNTQFVVWIYILSCRSKSKDDYFIVSIKHALFCCKCSNKEFKEALSVLEGSEMIEIIEDVTQTSRARNVDVTQTYLQRRGEERREEKRREDICALEADDKLSKPTPSDLMKAWNDNCHPLKKIRGLGKDRLSKSKARLDENPNLEYWIDVIKKAASSEFCSGSTGWMFDFDFLIKPDTQFKVLEGKYEDRSKVKKIRTILTGE